MASKAKCVPRSSEPRAGRTGHKIAITGAQCTGKTTLVNALGDEMEWDVVPELARIAVKKGYKLNGDADYSTQHYLIRAQMEWERERDGHNMVCDRSTLDALAHSIHMYCEGKLREGELRTLANLALPWAHTYDLHVLTVPGDCPMVDDGLRSTDVDFQNTIYRLCRHLLARYNIPFITVRGSVDERVGIVLTELKKRNIMK